MYDPQDLLARSYGLAAQLNCLNYCYLCTERTGDDGSSWGRGRSRNRDRKREGSPRWVLADLTRDKIRSLQNMKGEKEIGQHGWQGFLEEVAIAPYVALAICSSDADDGLTLLLFFVGFTRLYSAN